MKLYETAQWQFLEGALAVTEDYLELVTTKDFRSTQSYDGERIAVTEPSFHFKLISLQLL